MRLLFALLALVLCAAPAVLADGNATTNSTNETGTNTTATNTTTNATTANATGNQTNTTPPAPPASIVIALDGHGDGAGFYWTLGDSSEHNPTLHVQPGQHVTFHVKSVTSLHNIKIGDGKASAIINEGDSIDVEWTAPTESGEVTYICTIHGTAMSGKIQVGASGSSADSGASAGTIQGGAIDLGDHGYPDCKGTMVPAIVTKHVAGGPTLSDYGANCKASTAGAARPASGADYVIPASFTLVALGIVGIVWVHRAYKP